jgi:hypothetical protein
MTIFLNTLGAIVGHLADVMLVSGGSVERG